MRPVSDIKRSEKPFEVISDMTPAGDQPEAIAEITRRVRAGNEHTVLLGATGVRRPRDQHGLPGVGGGIAGPGRISTGSR